MTTTATREITFSCRNKDNHDESTTVAAPEDSKLSAITAHLLSEQFLSPLAGGETWQIRIERTNEIAAASATLESAGVKDDDVLHWTRSVNGAGTAPCSR